MNGVSSACIYTFIHKVFYRRPYSLANRVKKLRKNLVFVSSISLPNFNQVDLLELIALFRQTAKDNSSCSSSDFKCAHFMGGSVGINIKKASLPWLSPSL